MECCTWDRWPIARDFLVALTQESPKAGDLCFPPLVGVGLPSGCGGWGGLWALFQAEVDSDRL